MGSSRATELLKRWRAAKKFIAEYTKSPEIDCSGVWLVFDHLRREVVESAT
jgi:hypothetical protein